jgi:hypothetical protein
MKVKDLIAKLAELDPERDIFSLDREMGDLEPVEIFPFKFFLIQDTPYQQYDWQDLNERTLDLQDGYYIA